MNPRQWSSGPNYPRPRSGRPCPKAVEAYQAENKNKEIITELPVGSL
jgi:hypothetical protein